MDFIPGGHKVSMHCQHPYKKFIGISEHNGWPEKNYTCLQCGVFISDYANQTDMQLYQQGELQEIEAPRFSG